MKTNHKRRYKINVLILTGIALGVVMLQLSCNDFLQVEPQAKQPSETFYQDESDAMKAVNAMYAGLHKYNFNAQPSLAAECMRSGDRDKGSDPGDGSYMNEYLNFTLTPTTNVLPAYWTGKYQEINLCNQVLDSVPQIDMDQDLKDRLLAEAKFVRAFTYFKLVRGFGDIPLRLHTIDPNDNADFNIPSTSADSVYMIIEQDLTEAAEVLPKQYDAENLGRVTKGAAWALHAKVTMYLKDWEQAYDLSKKVIDLGIYQLFPDYEQQFRIKNENNSGSVFEVQCAIVPGNSDASNSQYAQVQEIGRAHV